jgi:AraC-like DNA-binding protein
VSFLYQESPPPPRLAHAIECIWEIRTTADVESFAVLPDGCVDILFPQAQQPQVVGTMTTAERFPLAAGSHVRGIRFRPGFAHRALGVPAAGITDQTISLSDVWRASAMDMREILSRVEVDPPEPIHRAIAAMVEARGTTDLDWIARQANLSIRQFRRRCLDEAGLTPKHLCRILRFRHACKLAARDPDWACIAAEAGYYDQAHLIRDCKEFAGLTPVSLFSNLEVTLAS